MKSPPPGWPQRKERPNHSLERRPPTRNRRGGLLVACGPQATPYLMALVQHLQLHGSVQIVSCSTEESSAILAHGLRVCATNGPFQRFYSLSCPATAAETAAFPLPPTTGGDIKYSFFFQQIIVIPSFDLWWLLHIQDLPPQGWQHEEGVSEWIQTQWAHHLSAVPSQDPHALFASMAHAVPDAIARGQRLAQRRAQESSTLPMTNLHEMVSYLLKFSNALKQIQS
ncbi:MAG: RloB domain-containing protein [Magnetococcales bacterium]|nr:RloB domain-containing protein [Magnetococcales bacterium]